MHQPVLYHEIIHALQPQPGGLYVDGTVGAGGHAWGILDACSPDGKLLGMDLDPHALKLADKHLALYGDRVVLKHVSYVTLRLELNALGWGSVQGILLDLGVSSMQIDNPERGFSFRADAPLDMRFDPRQETTAAHLVNNLSDGELANLIYKYGEEKRSRKVARAIVSARPLYTTGQLAAVVANATSRRAQGIHPATRTFQALRIAVNNELDSIRKVLPDTVAALSPGGRLAVISFHSLEDRIVKRFMRECVRDCICPPKQPVCNCDHTATIKEINRKPIQPTEKEIIQNPRARSSRLRVAEKL